MLSLETVSTPFSAPNNEAENNEELAMHLIV